MVFDTFACDHCSRRTDTQGKLNKHLKTHTKPFSCETCPKSFALRLDLSRHIKARHRVGNQQYRCHVGHCTFTSNRNDNLKRHQRTQHGSTLQDNPVEKSDKTISSPQSSQQHFDFVGSLQLCNVSNFMRVAASGDLDRLKAFLDAGFTIETKADDQSTVLHSAARAGQAEVVSYLLASGASVSMKNQRGRLPIYEAILSNSPKTLECFLERMTQEQIRTSSQELERYLMQSGSVESADVYLTRLGSDFAHRTASRKLSFAVRTGHETLVATLLEDSNIDANNKASRYFAPIHAAAYYGRKQVMEILLACDRVDKSLRNPEGRQVLHIAASKGQRAIVEQLFRHPGVDANCRDDRAMTPLHVAASKGHSATVDQLIRHPSVDANCQDNSRMTPLHYASYYAHWKTVSLLLRHWELRQDGQCLPPDVSATSVSFTKEDMLHRLFKHPDFGGPNGSLAWSGKTLLHGAAGKGDCEVMSVLLAHEDIDVKKSDYYGGSPLMSAAKDGQLEAVRLLLQHKDIDVNQTGGWNKCTALGYARDYNNVDIVNLLLSHGAIDQSANAPTTIPTTTSIDDSQDTVLQPDHELQFDPSENYADDTPMEDWEENMDIEEDMEE